MDVDQLLKLSDIDLIKALANTNDKILIERNFKRYANEQLPNINDKSTLRSSSLIIRYSLEKNEEIPIQVLAFDY